MPHDPADTGPYLRARADGLRDLCHNYRFALRAGTIQDLTLAALSLDTDADRLDAALGAEVEARQADAVRLALMVRSDAQRGGVLRLMQRTAPVLPPGRAAKVLPFLPRTKASAPLLLAHDVPADPPGGAA